MVQCHAKNHLKKQQPLFIAHHHVGNNLSWSWNRLGPSSDLSWAHSCICPSASRWGGGGGWLSLCDRRDWVTCLSSPSRAVQSCSQSGWQGFSEAEAQNSCTLTTSSQRVTLCWLNQVTRPAQFHGIRKRLYPWQEEKQSHIGGGRQGEVENYIPVCFVIDHSHIYSFTFFLIGRQESVKIL